MSFGLYRIAPLKMSKGFWIMNGPIAAMLFAGMIILFLKPGKNSVLIWGKATSAYAGGFLPLMVLLCLVMGIGIVLTSIHEAAIMSFLERFPVLGPIVGSLITPTSQTLTPICEKAWANEAHRPMIMFFYVVSKNISIPLFMLLIMGFRQDTGMPARMYATGFIASLIILPIIRPLYAVANAICEMSDSAWKGMLTLVQ